ncbi:DUF6233 domain-containing protein [Streptomyces sp. NPDC005574]|uniref:DUF6233 domain-containing protein n=1 Tax=Streptomyces sp. NPDC005574 TaxID=3156891 RepID=UPI0033B6CCB3
MFDDLPPDLERLHTLRVWHTLWLSRVNAKIAALEQRQAEQERGRRSRPEPPEWLVELGISTGRPPVQVHAGDCHMAGKRRRAVERDEARRLLTTGVRACVHCRPDSRLHILDLCGHPPAATAARTGHTRPTRPIEHPYHQWLCCLYGNMHLLPGRGPPDGQHSPAPRHGAGPVGADLRR